MLEISACLGGLYLVKAGLHLTTPKKNHTPPRIFTINKVRGWVPWNSSQLIHKRALNSNVVIQE
jgi:hypothetical protein